MMAQWRIKNNHYYRELTEEGKFVQHGYSERIKKKIKKPWVAIFIGPDYHDAKEAGNFKTWQEALEYIKQGGTPFVINER